MIKILLGTAKKPKTIKLNAADNTVPAELALIKLIKSVTLVYLHRPLYTLKTIFTEIFENKKTPSNGRKFW
tara:strand:- start:252 stop:464 length:213 start_codon:yes stop_codon:yes gene_type:complete